MAPGEALPGVFVAIEGIDGSGKSTIAERLVAQFRDLGRSVILTREPGGTRVGEQIRALLLGPDSDDVCVETEALLFAAARAQLVREVIGPALDQGAVVVSDRFVDSSLAYQWGGRGLPLSAVKDAQSLAIGDLTPDFKLLLDIPAEMALARRLAIRELTNRLDTEELEFHRRVRDAYLALAAGDPASWRVIDASRTPQETWEDAWAALVDFGLDESRPVSGPTSNPSQGPL